MATIGHDSGGRRRVLFVARDGSRKTVRLGKCSERDAQQICRHIEALVAANIASQPIPRETAVWLASIGDTLHSRLTRAGLVEPRAEVDAVKLALFIDSYIASRIDTKPQTVINLKAARRELVNHFGDDKLLAAITAGDADAFRLAALGRGLAENTVRRLCGRARQFFRVAIRREIIHRNPFEGIRCTVVANQKRQYFVAHEEMQKVLDACPDAEWRLIVALCRYGGIRCPSELLPLRWSDIDLAAGRVLIHSSKTEHHEGGATRIMPIFIELRPYLEEAQKNAKGDNQYVITRYRDTSANLRTQFQRIILRAGLEPWPKLFQNLRASRATELADVFPSHVCAAWLGHTEKIADGFYRQVTDAHFRRATGLDAAPKNTLQKAAQNSAQSVQAENCTTSQRKNEEECNFKSNKDLQTFASPCRDTNPTLMPGTGLEPARVAPLAPQASASASFATRAYAVVFSAIESRVT